MRTGSFVGTDDNMFCFIICSDGPHGAAIHLILHAQILQCGLSSGKDSAEHRRICVGVLQHFSRAVVGMSEKALGARKPMRQVMLQ